MRRLLCLFAVAVTVLVTILVSYEHDHARDPRLAEVERMQRELQAERAELDRISRELAAFEASNKVAADEIRILQTEAHQQ